jgi:PII-like signaling protein
MPLEYKTIAIFTGEDVYWKGKPLADAVNEFIVHQKLAARCIVTKGIAGCFENGEVCAQSMLEFSDNMPLKIEIFLPAAEAEDVLKHLIEMTVDGVVAITEPETISYK